MLILIAHCLTKDPCPFPKNWTYSVFFWMRQTMEDLKTMLKMVTLLFYPEHNAVKVADHSFKIFQTYYIWYLIKGIIHYVWQSGLGLAILVCVNIVPRSYIISLIIRNRNHNSAGSNAYVWWITGDMGRARRVWWSWSAQALPFFVKFWDGLWNTVLVGNSTTSMLMPRYFYSNNDRSSERSH